MIQKIFKYLKYFCSDFYGYVGKWLDKKAKVNFNIYNVTNWEINNCNTHIAQYFKKLRQSFNKTWSVNRM